MTTLTDDSAIEVFADALEGAPCTVSGLDAIPTPVPVDRWRGEADRSDRALLAHCLSPAIDLGCGPGRMAETLAREGVSVLGVDLAPQSVALARARGVDVLRTDVLGPLPQEGAWSSVLLADGNIGIGGDPARLLRRARRLLAPGGVVVVDLAPPGTGLAVGRVRLHAGGRTSGWFPWAVLGADAVRDVASSVGLSACDLHLHDGRWFAVLARDEVPTPCLS
ncbi:MAG TPA: methyltransferase domain-containing protein [Nocardioidaceae bacterium]|nr:methyltransferase domain-containing protein [Nocardioidaceae bacterium]